MIKEGIRGCITVRIKCVCILPCQDGRFYLQNRHREWGRWKCIHFISNIKSSVCWYERWSGARVGMLHIEKCHRRKKHSFTFSVFTIPFVNKFIQKLILASLSWKKVFMRTEAWKESDAKHFSTCLYVQSFWCTTQFCSCIFFIQWKNFLVTP